MEKSLGMEKYDLFIIGGGAAGIAAARAAYAEARGSYAEAKESYAEAKVAWAETRTDFEEAYAKDKKKEKAPGENTGRVFKIGLADRGSKPGGILRQCFHKGFGQEQTGVEYADSLLDGFPEEIDLFMNTTVLSVNPDKKLVLSSQKDGIREIAFERLILATGCLEIPAGALPIAGDRPQGVYTAGEMQARMNLDQEMPEGPVVILGSGDLGLIMADQIGALNIPVTLVEQKDQCGGLARNRKCLMREEISLITGATIRDIVGEKRIEGVILEDGKVLPCRSLLIAAGLKPDRQLIRKIGQPEWLTLCGNCRQVHPMVEGVVAEGEKAGRKAASSSMKNSRG